jgi:hypothetical protein
MINYGKWCIFFSSLRALSSQLFGSVKFLNHCLTKLKTSGREAVLLVDTSTHVDDRLRVRSLCFNSADIEKIVIFTPMAEYWRLVPLNDSQDPLESIRDPYAQKKARAIWEQIKEVVRIDEDQRVIYTPDEKGSPLPLLLNFLIDSRDTSRPLDLHRFVCLIKPYVNLSTIDVSRRKLFKNRCAL